MKKNEESGRSGPAKGWARKAYYMGLLYLVAVSLFVWGYAAGRYEAFPFQYIDNFVQEIVAFVEGGQDADRRISLKDRIILHRLERRSDFTYSGFHRRDPAFVDDGYLLLSRFSKKHGQSIVELVELSEFETLHTWIPPLEEILDQSYRDEDKNSPGGYRIFHPVLLKDGSIVFHSGAGPLIKINRYGEFQWAVNKCFHHSIEVSHEGNLVIPIILSARRMSILPGFRGEGVAVVTTDGEILHQYPLTDVLMENGYRGLLMGVGKFEKDRFHVNDAQPIHRDQGAARIGDIAISMRHLSTVLLFRPSAGEVVWLQTGPWLNQHDVNHLPDGTFSVFGNDSYRLDEELSTRDGDRVDTRPAGNISQIYVYDSATGDVLTPYSNILTEAKMYSRAEGRARLLPGGDVVIEQSGGDRLLRVSKEKVRWEFVNGVTETTSGRLNWCRYLTPDEIDTAWLTSK